MHVCMFPTSHIHTHTHTHTEIFVKFACTCNVVYFLLGNSLASEFKCQHFGTHCLFHLHGQVGTYPPMKMEHCVSI